MPHPPRLPALGAGLVSFLWAVALGGFVFIGMLSIAISLATSLIVAIACGFVIYFANMLFGADAPARRARR
ncbi:MAG: hypothetical protein KJ051_03195 [Thermoleophilia bacterium]|nr:hypothetical protein [Thermoleophilia bacterium]